MDKPSTSKAGAKKAPGRKTLRQIRVTFLCPLCHDVLLCSKGSTSNAQSMTKHFREKHPSHSKKKCRICLEEHNTVQERVQCLLAASAKKRRIDRVTSFRTVTPNVRPPRILEPIQTVRSKRLRKGPRLDDPFRSAAHLVRDFRLSPPRPFRPSPHEVASAPLHLAIVPPPIYATSDRYLDYLARLYESAGNTARGKAVRLLCCFEKDMFFHLFVSWKKAEAFKRLCDERSDLVQLTEFYCFCDSTTSSSEDVETKLHLHALARIPDEKEFKKQIWNLLTPDRKGIRCKSSVHIQSFDHFFNTILYVSQRKKCSTSKYRTKQEPDSEKLEDDLQVRVEDRLESDDKSGGDHFAMNVELSNPDQLYLTLAFPTIALNYVHRFSQPRHLQHYELHCHSSTEYRSSLSNVLSKIDYFQHAASNDVTFDAGDDDESNLTAKDFLLKFCEDDETRFVRWTGAAKDYCKMKFQTKIVKRSGRETVTRAVAFRGDKAILRNEANGKRATAEEPESLLGILVVLLKTKNVHLKGIARDVQRVRKWLAGCNQKGENSFTFMFNRTRFDITYQYEERIPIPNSEEEDDDLLDD